MARWRVVLAPSAVAVVRQLPPDVKRVVKEALIAIAADPHLGKELLRELRGLRSYRARRYRLVYELETSHRLVQVVAVGHRDTIYDELVRSRGEEPR